MPASHSTKPYIAFVVGLSGAGMSTALNALEDGGFYCIDNLPVEVLEYTIQLIAQGKISSSIGFAIGMDLHDERTVLLLPALKRSFQNVVDIQIVFLTADEQIVATRYSTTRRRHPFLEEGETLTEAIAKEHEVLSPLEESADIVLDTSSWSPHALARAIEQQLGQRMPSRTLHLTITSFGFKFGQARPVDLLFDIRFLDNPYFVAELRDKTGIDSEVASYVFSNETAHEMFRRIEDTLRFLLPLYYREGKHYLRLGIGCSGGRHRSVAFAEHLGSALLQSPIENVLTTVVHRDIEQS